jgi:hypothetical protein
VLALQLLAHAIGVAPMLVQPLCQPSFQSLQHRLAR